MPLNLGAISALLCLSLTASLLAVVTAEDPYRFFQWNVTYGDIYPLGVRQRVIVYESSICIVYMICRIKSLSVFDLIETDRIWSFFREY